MDKRGCKEKIISTQTEIEQFIDDIENSRLDTNEIKTRYASIKSRLKEEYHYFHLRHNRDKFTEEEHGYYMPFVSDIYVQGFSVPTNASAEKILKCLSSAAGFCSYWMPKNDL